MSESLDQEIRTLQSIYWSDRDPEGLAFAPLADAFLRKGEVKEALDLLTDGTSRHPDYATGHVVTTRLYHQQGMQAEAELAVRRTLELDPENTLALSTLAAILEERGDGEELSKVAVALVDLDPESDEAQPYADVALAAARTMEAVEPSEEPLLEALEVTADEAPIEVEESPELAEALDALGLSETGTDATVDDAVSDDLGGFASVPEPELADLDALGSAFETVGDDHAPEPDFIGFDAPAPEAADLEALAPDELAGEVELESEAMDLEALAPDEPSADAESELEVMDLGALAPDEPMVEAEPEVMDLGSLAPDEPEVEAEAEVMDLAALAPDEPMVEAEPEVMDLGALAPDEPSAAEPEAEVMDLDALAPDEPSADAEPELEVMELDALAPAEPDVEAEPEVMDLGALAPDEPAAEAEPEVMDLDALAPDEPTDEAEPEVMDLAALAPDEPAVEAEPEVMDLDALAPDETEPEPEVMELGALAPDEPMVEAEPEVMDLGALAPDEAEPEVMDLGALAPDEPADEAEPEVMDLDALAPDGPVADLAAEPAAVAEPEVMDLGALAPDEPPLAAAPGGEAEDSEPVYTRTLAELYVKQGFTSRALSVYQHLLEGEPNAADLRERIAELEGAAPAVGGAESGPVPSVEHPAAEDEEHVETLARDLAESGDGHDDVDTPFAWTDDEAAVDGTDDSGPKIGEYFDGLLSWDRGNG